MTAMEIFIIAPFGFLLEETAPALLIDSVAWVKGRGCDWRCVVSDKRVWSAQFPSSVRPSVHHPSIHPSRPPAPKKGAFWKEKRAPPPWTRERKWEGRGSNDWPLSRSVFSGDFSDTMRKQPRNFASGLAQPLVFIRALHEWIKRWKATGGR